MSSSGTTKASSQGGGFQVNSSLSALTPHQVFPHSQDTTNYVVSLAIGSYLQHIYHIWVNIK